MPSKVTRPLHMGLHRIWRRRAVGSLGIFLVGSLACGDLVGNAELPPGTRSPNTYNTPEGAIGLYLGTKQSLGNVFIIGVGNALQHVGALTDELASSSRGNGPTDIGATGDPIDARLLPERQTGDVPGRNTYVTLQSTRNLALQAIGLLRAYIPESPALRGEMQTLEGYAELLLAELYCSGVPLSTIDYQQDFTYRPSSTTTEVLQHAIALFDSALTISSDSASVMGLARVLKGRALLDLGQYAQAAQAVATVPDAFQYQIPVGFGFLFSGWTVADREGINGLPYASSGDPRLLLIPAGTTQFDAPRFRSLKYPNNTISPVILANGVEARLIEAEAALHANPNDPTWLTILNTLRTTCTDSASCATPAPAGTGGVDSLPPLTDPGSDTARVSLLFEERAYWLFLTAHRQGDLRRLVRNYGRPQDTVYPTGPYYGQIGVYGSDVTLPIPPSERPNPLFHGCLNRGA